MLGDLDANEFIGRDIPVRLFGDGLGMGEVADAAIYSGRSPDKTIEPDPYYTFQADRAFVREYERRRGLMPKPAE